MNKRRKYWLVGHTFGKEGSQLGRFVKEGIWETKHDDDNSNDQRLKATVKEINVGDILILKSTATKGPRHNLPFLRVKGIGIVTGEMRRFREQNCEYCQYPVKYVNVKDKDFDGAIYGFYRKMTHQLDDKLVPIREYIDAILENKLNNKME